MLAVELARLRVELIELAFTLDRRGRPDAADLAQSVSARLELLLGENSSTHAELAAD